MTVNPCYNDGRDCPRRRVGCRANCEDWKKWLVIHETENKQRRKAKRNEADDFLIENKLTKGRRYINQTKGRKGTR